MRNVTIVVALLLGRFALSQESKPYPDPDVGGGFASRPLLEEPAVQKEIQLTAKQRGQLRSIAEEAFAARQGLSDPVQGNGDFDFQRMMVGIEQAGRQEQSAQAKILSAAQKKRLRQIEWQREGYFVLARKDVASELKLGESQRKEIDEAISRMRTGQMNRMFFAPKPGADQPAKKPASIPSPENGFAMNAPVEGFLPPQMASEDFQAQAAQSVADMKAGRRSASAEIEKLLTAAQKSQFLGLLGPRFDFGSIAPPPGNPGGNSSPSNNAQTFDPAPAKNPNGSPPGPNRNSRKTPKR